MSSNKLSKSSAGYLSARLVGTEQVGTKCGKCYLFIKSSSECLITDDPKVSAEKGTCTQYLKGSEMRGWAMPLRLVPKEVVGYIEGAEVPTYCGRCEYFTEHGRLKGECEIVEGSIEWGACCNSYEAK